MPAAATAIMFTKSRRNCFIIRSSSATRLTNFDGFAEGRHGASHVNESYLAGLLNRPRFAVQRNAREQKDSKWIY
ncbi:MAG: hypothetical protein OER43_13900 [Gammaproteobacteria bacterium]|nr:hypothetical protein [Gammaproteobacteria bacterium]